MRFRSSLFVAALVIFVVASPAVGQLLQQTAPVIKYGTSTLALTTATADTVSWDTTGANVAHIQMKMGTVTGTYSDCTAQAYTSWDAGTTYLALGDSKSLAMTSSTPTAWILFEPGADDVTTTELNGFGNRTKFTIICSGYGTSVSIVTAVTFYPNVGTGGAGGSTEATLVTDGTPLPVYQYGNWTVNANLRDALGRTITADKLIPKQAGNYCSNAITDDAAISTAVDAIVIPGLPGYHTVICAVRITADAAEDVSEVEGTGTACGTGSIAHAGSTTDTDGQALAANGGYQSERPYMLNPGNDWCIKLGTTNGVRGQVWFVRVAAP